MSQPIIPTIPVTQYQRAAGTESSACQACGQEAEGYAFCATAGCLPAGATVVSLPDGTTYAR
jgi:hypothetical protein